MQVFLLLVLIVVTLVAVVFQPVHAAAAAAASSAAAASCAVKEAVAVHEHDVYYQNKPFVDGAKTFFGGKIQSYTGHSETVTSPILDGKTQKRASIGRIAQMKREEMDAVLTSAKQAWDRGQGIWPQMTMAQRIAAIERVVASLKQRRDEIVTVLMWEICKNKDDAAAEFDRTMVFITSVIEALKNLDTEEGSWKSVGGILARFRRTALGIILCLGPFNYPFNETYATLIPALLTGNIIIMKIPTTGGLAHMLTMEAYAEHLPPGVMNFVSGSGRELLSPLMNTGDIDALAFIGGSKAADTVIKAHPNPHRLKVFLQLEGKNLGIVLPDANIDNAVEQIVIGSTTYNGQRCTAVKLIMLHTSIVNEFLEKFKQRIGELKWGLPWEAGVSITPLPEANKVQYLSGLIHDAVQKGAQVINQDQGGCDIHGNLFRPAIVYPVTSSMRLWHEEQFGPVIPIAVYNETQQIFDYIHKTPFGQQAAVFTTQSHASGEILDMLSTAVGRININTQCSRSPDVVPFSGRRSSALGTMSVTEAIKSFSIETVIAGKDNDMNQQIMKGYEDETRFLAPLHANPAKHSSDL